MLIGKLEGLPIKGMAVFVIQRGIGLEVSSFATASYDPPARDIPRLKSELRTSLLRMIAGGVASQMFAQLPTLVGADDDRRRFKRIKSPGTKLTFEEVVKDLQGTFKDHEKTFRQLVDLIRTEFRKRIDLPTRKFTLLTEAELEPVLKSLSSK